MADNEHVGILKQGVPAWNTWREENPEVRPNLREVRLRGADLRGVDLRRVDLEGADLRRADFSDADLRRADLRGVDLRGADLRRTNLRRADFEGADLGRTDLSDARNLSADQLSTVKNLYQAELDSSLKIQLMMGDSLLFEKPEESSEE